MKAKQAKQQLAKMPDDAEVYAMNTLIDSDGCPGFRIDAIEYEPDSHTVLLLFEDDNYVCDEFLVGE